MYMYTNEKKTTLSRTIKRVGWSGQFLYLINHLRKRVLFRDLEKYSKAEIHVFGIFVPKQFSHLKLLKRNNM